MKINKIAMSMLTLVMATSMISGCVADTGKKVESKQEETTVARKQVINETSLISNTTALDFETDITVEKTMVEKSVEIDAEIQREVDSEKYTLDNPKIMVNPYGNSPLTALVIFTTEEECSIKVTVKGKSADTDVTGTVDSAKNHRVPVIGLYAAMENEVELVLINAAGEEIGKKTVKITTGELPEKLVDAVIVDKKSETSSYNLVEVSGFGTKNPFAFDHNGEVRWYLNGKYASYGYFPLSNNHFIIMDSKVLVGTDEKPHAQELYEMDYMGRVYNIYYAKNGAHHEIIEKTPGGNLLIATSSLEGYVEDGIEEIDRETGKVVKSIEMQQVLGKNNKYVDLTDWAHVNTVQYIPEDDTIVCSPRNTHSMVKFNWTTNEVKWILADPAVWKGTDNEKYVLKATDDDIQWFYQQHSTYQIEKDLDNNPDTIEVACFDNNWTGTRKLKGAKKTDYSHVIFYAVNETEGTVEMLRCFPDVKAKITSNFTFDAEDNAVWSMGGVVAYPDEDCNGHKAYITEFDYDTEEVLNRYEFKNSFYRAYEFEPDFNSCAAKLELSENNTKGELRIASKQTEKANIPEMVMPDKVQLTVTSVNLLFLKANDHTISKVEFVGNENTYMLDYTNTLGSDEYKHRNYKIVAPFQNLQPDTYTVVVTYKGERYTTNKTITIK